jgi:hypothetical protein
MNSRHTGSILVERCSAVRVQVPNDAAQDGLWKIKGKRQVIYARNDLSAADRLKAARQIVEGGQ